MGINQSHQRHQVTLGGRAGH